MSDEKECIDMKVDVGVLKTQVSSLTVLCDKMDKVIDRLMDNHDRVVNQIYTDMEKRKSDTVADIKEMHSRISTVDRNLSDKIELTERRIMEEIKSLRADISKHNKEEDTALKKILEWKWFVTGGVVIFAWLVTNVNLETLGKLFN
jgi:chromosome segregation ATPase